MLKKSNLPFSLLILLFLISCQKEEDNPTPEQIETEKIIRARSMLQGYTWGFYDFKVDVKYEIRALPLLANVADENGMVQPGTYKAVDIFGNTNRQDHYSYLFQGIELTRDTTGNGVFHHLGDWFIFSSSEMSIRPPDSALAMYFNYEYQADAGLFTMTAGQLTNAKINDAINQRVADAIISGKPDDLADLVVNNILGNEEIQAAIQQALYDLIHGKLDEIASNPEEAAQKLAEIIVDKLKEVDWESVVYQKVLGLLEELQVDNPEERAQELAEQISGRIETSISQEDIYNAILPILEAFENETLPELVPVIADAIYGLISEALSEENIYDKIYPAWTAFSEVDSTSVAALADTLGAVITGHFFDADSLAAALVPFIETLQSTGTLQIPALAQDIIDEVLVLLVDNLNATFPGLELDPDWNQVKTVLTSALTVIKSNLGGMTVEEGAAQLAGSIIGIMDSIITQGIASAIFLLQDIPADQASQVIAAWVTNLLEMAEPQIVAFLEEKLNELVAMFNAEEIAENISAIIHGKIMEVFSPENIYTLIYPVMEQLSQIDIEAAAQKITDWLFDLNLIQDGISEEQVIATITEMISELIGNMNVDEASQKLSDHILQSDLVEGIDGDILKRVIEIKAYELLIELGKYANAIDQIELNLIQKN